LHVLVRICLHRWTLRTSGHKRSGTGGTRPQIAMPGGPAASALAEEPHRPRLGRLFRTLVDGGYQNV
jgi:hypothetical protein